MSRPAPPAGEPIDLSAGDGHAVVWGLASDDLNVNLVAWPAGDGVREHRNDERDVLVVVTDGALEIALNGVPRRLARDQCMLIPKGAVRRLVAGADGVRYLTVHMRRTGLTIGPGVHGQVGSG